MRFEGRTVPVDGSGRRLWPSLARARQAGRGLGAMDAMIAAICPTCDLLLATRNLADFETLGIELHAPL